LKRIAVHLGDDPDSMKVYEMANSKKLPVRYVSEWVLKNAKKDLINQLKARPMTDEELTIALKLALDHLATGRILAVKLILRDILDKRGVVVSQSVDDGVLEGLENN
jgi:hypothetical protein